MAVKANQTYKDADGETVQVISVQKAGALAKRTSRFGIDASMKVVWYQYTGSTLAEWLPLADREVLHGIVQGFESKFTKESL